MSDVAYTTLYTRLIEVARPGARIAYWNMMVPHALPDTLDSQVIDHSAQAKDLFIRDKAFFYSRFLIEEVK